MKYVSHLVCINCGKEYRADPERYLCLDCGEEGLLDVVYDYPRIRRDWSRDELLQNRELSIWRYLPLLPVEPGSLRPGLRVGWTPLYREDALAAELGLAGLYLKDDGLNPTGSLKDRASAIGVVKALEAGADVIACSSTGNAASSLAGNAASIRGKGGRLQAVIFIPGRAPAGKVSQLLIYGAVVVSVQGSYQEAFHLSSRAIEKWGWYNRNAAVNPYLMEGKKTVTLELLEQLGWQVPDWLAVSVGDGCTIAGAWKGLLDLYQLGFIERLPRLLGVQAEGCAPITRAFRKGLPLEVSGEDSLADSIAVGSPRNYRKAIRAVRDSGGQMINVSDGEILEMMGLLGKSCGLFAEPAGAAGLAGVKKAAGSGLISRSEKAAGLITGNGLKDIQNARKAAGSPFEVQPELEKLEILFAEEGIISEDE